MLNKIGVNMNLQVKSIYIQKSLCLYMAVFMFSAQAVDNKTLEILHLLKNKNYTVAVPLLEQQIQQVKDLKKKGYYSLLLNQLPTDIKMKKPRYEYAFIAGQYAQNISRKKQLLLWMEAGDGFFKTGHLKKASYCYQKALSYTQIEDPEKPYILHKQAWIYINQKKWDKAYALLSQAIAEKAQKLKSLILFDMGKIWVESQYFKNKIAVSTLAKEIKALPIDDRKHLIQGIAQGLRRVEKQSLLTLVSALSSDKALSTAILNKLLTNDSLPVRSACQLIPWIESTKTTSINKKPVLSVLNSCTRHWIAKKKNPQQSQQLKRIARLYTQFDRKGMERWPLALSYHHLKKSNKACAESLYQLTEILTLAKDQVETSLKESLRFCKKAKKLDTNLVLKTAKTLLFSPLLSQKYKSEEGDYESTLLNFFKLQIFSSFLKSFILNQPDKWEKGSALEVFPSYNKALKHENSNKVSITAHKNWRGKAFLPLLLLPHINSYKKADIKAFMDRFSVRPLSLYYLNILIARKDLLTEQNLSQWIPLADINSYAQSKPYIQAFLSGHLTKETEKALSVFFKKSAFKNSPSYMEKKQISLFLALYYLKSHQIEDIFKNWDNISSVFRKKDLAVDLFEKTLLDEGKSCQALRSVINKKNLKNNKADHLQAFIYQSCAVLYPPQDNVMMATTKAKTKLGQSVALGTVDKGWLKSLPKIQNVPAVLRSSALARDFMFLKYVQKNTLRLETSITHLENKTPQMIMKLRRSLSRYQKHQWRLKKVAKVSQFLLFRQIDLFEKELSRLSQSSPYGQKYQELRKIVRQWR